MSFNWNDYLDLAKSLQKATSNKIKIKEACYRTAVSRAYYAVYHIALDFAEENLGYLKFIGKNAGKNHRKLGIYYKKCTENEYKNLGSILVRMHGYRINCDYYNPANVKSMMDNAILDADNILEIINQKSI